MSLETAYIGKTLECPSINIALKKWMISWAFSVLLGHLFWLSAYAAAYMLSRSISWNLVHHVAESDRPIGCVKHLR